MTTLILKTLAGFIFAIQLLKKWKYMTLPALMNLVQALRTPSIYQEDAVTLVWG
jgi:hypothetical protein